jgi:hypothetical protein
MRTPEPWLTSTRSVYFEFPDNDPRSHPAHTPPPSPPQWWPATLLRRADAKDGQGREVYVILYEADTTTGYPEPTEHRVSFLDDHELFDVGECDLLDWRIEGTGWERPRPTANLVEEPGHGLVESTSLAEVAEQGRKIELASGKSLRSEMAELVAALPPEAQHGMAERLNAGLAAFSEEIATMLKETDGPVIQLEHVEEMLTKLHARLGRGGAPPPSPGAA